MTIENDLREVRSKQELTQQELGEAMGVSRQTINAIETGKYNPSLELALKLSSYFETEVQKLFRIEE
ncbi:MAG: helix-turn-helix transcriptional regulator [Nanohaloarchaea archaeon]|nr:helix-turn-helix transcriptional regulator [Candidatus Nanohaloarchaea archaeon]